MKYEVKLPDGSQQKVDTVSEARALVASGGTYSAVKA